MKRSALQSLYAFLVLATPLCAMIIIPGFWTPYVQATFPIISIVILLTTPLYLYLSLTDKTHRPSMRSFTKIGMIAFIGMFLLASVFGENLFISFFGDSMRMGGLFLYILIFCYALFVEYYLSIHPEQNKKRLITAVVGYATIAASYGSLEYISALPRITETFAPRSSSFFGNPSVFAAFLIMPFFFSLILSAQEKTYRFFAIASSTLIFLGLLSTGTRGVLVGLIAGLGVVAILTFLEKRTKQQKQKFLQILGCLLILGIGIFGLMSTAEESNTLAYRVTHLINDTAEQRIHFWQMGWEGVKEHPILGVGYGNFYTIADTHFHKELYQYEDYYIDKAHNYFVDVITGGGILTAIAFLLFLALVYRALWKGRRLKTLSKTESLLLCGGLTAYLGQAFFLFESASDLMVLGVFMGIVFYTEKTKGCKEGTNKQALIATGTATAITIIIIAFIFTPMLKDIRSAHKAVSTASDNWQEASSMIEKIGTHGFVYDPYIKAAHASYMLMEAMNVETSISDELKETYALTASSHKQTTKRNPQRAKHWHDYINTQISFGLSINPSSLENITEEIQTLQSIAPNRIEHIIFLSQLKEFDQNINEAIVLLDEGLLDHPNNPTLLWRKGLLHLYLKEASEAGQALLSAIENGKNVEDQETSQWLMVYLNDQKNTDGLIMLLKKMAQFYPENPDYIKSLAATYAQIEEFEMAKNTAERLLDIDPDYQDEINTFLEGIEPSTE